MEFENVPFPSMDRPRDRRFIVDSYVPDTSSFREGLSAERSHENPYSDVPVTSDLSKRTFPCSVHNTARYEAGTTTAHRQLCGGWHACAQRPTLIHSGSLCKPPGDFFVNNPGFLIPEDCESFTDLSHVNASWLPYVNGIAPDTPLVPLLTYHPSFDMCSHSSEASKYFAQCARLFCGALALGFKRQTCSFLSYQLTRLIDVHFPPRCVFWEDWTHLPMVWMEPAHLQLLLLRAYERSPVYREFVLSFGSFVYCGARLIADHSYNFFGDDDVFGLLRRAYDSGNLDSLSCLCMVFCASNDINYVWRDFLDGIITLDGESAFSCLTVWYDAEEDELPFLVDETNLEVNWMHTRPCARGCGNCWLREMRQKRHIDNDMDICHDPAHHQNAQGDDHDVFDASLDMETPCFILEGRHWFDFQHQSIRASAFALARAPEHQGLRKRRFGTQLPVLSYYRRKDWFHGLGSPNRQILSCYSPGRYNLCRVHSRLFPAHKFQLFSSEGQYSPSPCVPETEVYHVPYSPFVVVGGRVFLSQDIIGLLGSGNSKGDGPQGDHADRVAKAKRDRFFRRENPRLKAPARIWINEELKRDLLPQDRQILAKSSEAVKAVHEVLDSYQKVPVEKRLTLAQRRANKVDALIRRDAREFKEERQRSQMQSASSPPAPKPEKKSTWDRVKPYIPFAGAAAAVESLPTTIDTHIKAATERLESHFSLAKITESLSSVAQTFGDVGLQLLCAAFLMKICYDLTQQWCTIKATVALVLVSFFALKNNLFQRCHSLIAELVARFTEPSEGSQRSQGLFDALPHVLAFGLSSSILDEAGSKKRFATLASVLSNYTKLSHGISDVMGYLMGLVRKCYNYMAKWLGLQELAESESGIQALDQWRLEAKAFVDGWNNGTLDPTPLSFDRLQQICIDGTVLLTSHHKQPERTIVQDVVQAYLPLLKGRIWDALSPVVTSSAGPRQEPVGVLMSGSPGVGKSAALYALNMELAFHILRKDPENLKLLKSHPAFFIWNYQPELKYDDAVGRQLIYNLDDIFQLKDTYNMGDSEPMKVIRLVSNFPVWAHPAHLESKGKILMKPMVLIGTTNCISVPALDTITSREAVLRRFAIHVVVHPAPEYCTDETRDLPITERRLDVSKIPLIDNKRPFCPDIYRFTDNREVTTKSGGTRIRREFENINWHEFVDLICTKYDENADNFKMFTESYMRPMVSRIDERLEVLKGERAAKPEYEAPVAKEKQHAGPEPSVGKAKVFTLPHACRETASFYFKFADKLGFVPRQVSQAAGDEEEPSLFSRFKMSVVGKPTQSATEDSLIQELLQHRNFADHDNPPVGKSPLFLRLKTALTLAHPTWGCDCIDYVADRLVASADLAEQEHHLESYLTAVVTKDFRPMLRGWKYVFPYDVDLWWQLQKAAWLDRFKAFRDAHGSRMEVVLSVLSACAGVAAIAGVVYGLYRAYKWYTQEPDQQAQSFTKRDPTAKTRRRRPIPRQGAQIDTTAVDVANVVWRDSMYNFHFTDGDPVAACTLTFICDKYALINRHCVERLRALREQDDDEAEGYKIIEPDDDVYLTQVSALNAPYIPVSVRDFEDFEVVGDERSDVVIVYLKSFPLPRTNILRYFVPEAKLNNTSEVRTLIVRPISLHTRRDMEVLAKPISSVFVEDPHRSYTIKRAMRYRGDFGGGSCGALGFQIDNSSQGFKLYTFHTSGDDANHNGTGQIVTKEEVEGAFNRMRSRVGIPSIDRPEVSKQSSKCGLAPNTAFSARRPIQPVHNSSATKIVLSKLGSLEGRYADLRTAPACLKPVVEAGVRYDPFEVAVAGYTKTPPSPEAFSLFERAAQYESAYVSRAFAELPQACPLQCISYREAIAGRPGDRHWSGIDRGTSPGVEYQQSCPTGWKGKTYWMGRGESYAFDAPDAPGAAELFSDTLLILRAASRGIRLENIFTDFLKDERRKLHKVRKPRFISGDPLPHLVASRMVFGDFARKSQASNVANGGTIGVNPYGNDWTRIHDHVASVGRRFVAGDLDSCDTTLHSTGIQIYLREVVQHYYANEGVGLPPNSSRPFEADDFKRLLVRTAFLSKHVNAEQLWSLLNEPEETFKYDWARARDVLAADIYNSLHAHGSVVYEWFSGHPSGHFLTALLTTGYVRTGFRTAFASEHPVAPSLGLQEFDASVAMVANGDDHVAGISDEALWFNPAVIKRGVAKFGMKYTNADKTEPTEAFLDLADVTFLKRRFRWDSSLCRWVAPLELEVIQEMPFWTKVGPREDDIAKETFRWAILELSLHDPKVWAEWSGPMIRCYEAAYGVHFPIRDRMHALDLAIRLDWFTM